MVGRTSKGWIGLDFGHRGITIAQVQRSTAGVRIAASAEIPRTGIPRAPEASAGTYHDVSRQELEAARMLVPGLSGRAAACVLPMSVTELTHATLPPAEPAEQLAMIANELGDTFSEGRGQRQFDFWHFDLPGDDKSTALMDVNVISVSARRTTPVTESLARAGLDCRVLDGLPHAVARAVTMAAPHQIERPLAGAHLAHDSAVFVLARGGAPVFTRHLRNGGTHRIITNLSESFGLLEAEAVRVLREFGLPNAGLSDAEGRQIQEVVCEVVSESVNEIAGELRRTLAYLATLGSEIVPDGVCLLGDGAAIRNLAPHLSEKTGVSVWPWDLPDAPLSCNNPGTPPALFGVAAALSSLAWES